MCRDCNKRSQHNGLRRCRNCAIAELAYKHLGSRSHWPELLSLLERQQYRCAYSGLPIDIGAGASVEHVVPRSKDPERSQDISNLRFIHSHVNYMKKDFDLHEWLQLLKSILSHFGYAISREDA